MKINPQSFFNFCANHAPLLRGLSETSGEISEADARRLIRTTGNRNRQTTVQLKEQLFTPTLAHKLGDVPHVSGLLRRIAQLSGAGERVAEWLLKVAIARGANHYRREFDPTLPADLLTLSDEEIGVALCLGQNPYNLDALRVAAQFLSSPRINAERLCRLAEHERCEPVLLHIAEVAKQYAPEQEPWATLRNQLHPRLVPRTDALPHWTRLVSHTGTTREGPPRTDWLCRLD